MSGFDKDRFAESLGAAVLGAFAYEKLKSHSDGMGNGSAEDLRKFQRALIVARHQDQFSEEMSTNYLQRISALEPYNRPKYISFTLQPSPEEFDIQLTALAIFDHASASDQYWAVLVSALSLNEMGAIQKIDHALSRQVNEERERKIEKILRRSKTLFGRIINFFSWAITFDLHPEVWEAVRKRR